MIIKFKVPLVKLRNVWETMNRWEKTKFKDDLNESIYYEIRLHFKTTIPEFKKVKPKYILHTRRQVDGDSIVEMRALITNAIRYSGLVPDDSPAYFDEVAVGYVKDDGRFVEVELEADNGRANER